MSLKSALVIVAVLVLAGWRSNAAIDREAARIARRNNRGQEVGNFGLQRDLLVARRFSPATANGEEIEEFVRDVARQSGIDEYKFAYTAWCESRGFDPYARGDYRLHRDRRDGKSYWRATSHGLWQWNEYSHPEMKPIAYNWQVATLHAAKLFQTRPFEWTCYRQRWGYKPALVLAQN